MFEIIADKTRKLLVVRFSGRVGPAETADYLVEVKPKLGALDPGFRLLTDLSRLEAMDPGCVPHLKTAMDLCNDAGVSKIVRVIPDPSKDIGLKILSLFHYHRQIQIATCDTLAEAEEILSR